MDTLIDRLVKKVQVFSQTHEGCAIRQVETTAASLAELSVAVGRDSMHTEMGFGTTDSLRLEECSTAIALGIGRVVVDLVLLAEQTGLDIYDCISVAYAEIKDRKGKLINGKFVKEEDL